MKVVDEGSIIPYGQAQGSSGLNKKPIKVEAKVCEQSALDIVESVLLPSHVFLQIAISHIKISFAFILFIIFTLQSLILFDFSCYLLLPGSHPSHESGG